jgi:SulP family sulfate permease
MAFGVALLAPFGLTSAHGALTGLIGAVALSLASGLAGATAGLISAPNGPSLVLLSGGLAAVHATGISGPAILPALSAILLLAGAVQILIGLLGGGRLIKFMPYPVISGFLTGAALLMIISQYKAITKSGGDTDLAIWIWIPWATAALTFAVTDQLPKLLPRIPGTIAGLLAGTVFFLALTHFQGTIPAAWVVGALPDFDPKTVGASPAGLMGLPWKTIVPSGLALALLAATNTMLTAVVSDVATGLRHHSNRELFAQGVGQALAGVAGGMGGSSTTGATMVALKTGGRRWAELCAALSIAGIVLFGGPVGAYIPIGVLAGIVLQVAVRMIDLDVLRWILERDTREDALITVVVTGVTVAYDLITAIAIGVAITILLYLRAQVRAPIIHRHSTGTQIRSSRSRPRKHRELLDLHGGRISFYELRGDLIFATADQLYEQLRPDLDQPVWVILHLRRVAQVDLTGIKILWQIGKRLKEHGGQLIFCTLAGVKGLDEEVEEALQKVSLEHKPPHVPTFNGTDEALEFAEDALLAALGAEPQIASRAVPLADSDLCRGMAPENVAFLHEVMQPVHLAKGERLFAAGEHGDCLYVVLRGEMEIRLPTTGIHFKRLGLYGPRTFFGEVAFFDNGPRTADAVAIDEVDLLRFDQEAMARLIREEKEGAVIALLTALGKAEVHHLRWSITELSRLLQW